jgi:hypothetical protein
MGSWIVVILVLMLISVSLGAEPGNRRSLEQLEADAESLGDKAKLIVTCVKNCGLDGRAALVEQQKGETEAERFMFECSAECMSPMCTERVYGRPSTLSLDKMRKKRRAFEACVQLEVREKKERGEL